MSACHLFCFWTITGPPESPLHAPWYTIYNYSFVPMQCDISTTAKMYLRTHSAFAVSDTKELVPWLTRGSRHLIENILTLGFPQDGCRQLLYINKALGAEGEDSTYLEHICFHRPRLWRWRWTDVGHGAVCRGDEAPACRHGGRAVETVCRRGQAHRGVEAEKNSFKDFLRFTIDIPDVNISIDFHQCNVH